MSSESRHTNPLCSISQCDANSLLSEISGASLMLESAHIAKSAASWLDDFLVWMSPEAFGCCRKFVDAVIVPLMTRLPPCCSPDEDSCDLDGVCKDCTTCFLHSDLDNGRPSTAQFKEKLPWFLNALPSADCAKGGHGAYTSSVDLNGYKSGVIRASEFRTYHTPLRKQFSSRVSDSLKGAAFLVCLVITSSLWSSAIIVLVLAMIAVDLLGVMAILDIQLNAVFVVNLIMSIGIAEVAAVVWHRANLTGLARKTNCSVDNISALNTGVVLSMFRPPSRSVPIEREQELETSTLSHLTD
ncbi:unnamed protein product [Camellia sinensis]